MQLYGIVRENITARTVHEPSSNEKTKIHGNGENGMERDIIKKLQTWKDSRRRKPLILTGVRQCGKTYSIKEFGSKYFRSIVYLNFEENEHFKDIFDYDFDVQRIIKEIQTLMNVQIQPGKTLLVFDEIQECPRAITSLKYFCEKLPELHVICAGSLLGVALRRENISFPVGKVNRLEMRPLCFREFIAACGGRSMLEVLSEWEENRPLPELYTAPMEKYLKSYFAVGGMPEAVKEWSESGNIAEVEAIQEEILRDYADDFSKHAPVSEIEKIRWIWDSVPQQLTKDNNKFVFSHVKSGKRGADLEGALHWLLDAGLIQKLELVENVEVPLSSVADSTWFKIYMSDIGLLRKKSGLAFKSIMERDELYSKFKGALTENYVMNELISDNFKPYYWNSGNRAEIDFLIEDENKIIPIEVKAADNTQAKSYRMFSKKYQPELGIRTSLKNYAINEDDFTKTIHLPLYMLWSPLRGFGRGE